MINFIPCNYDQSIVLGEDPRLYPYIVSDKSNLILNYYGYYNIGKPIFGLEPPVEIFNAPETELIQKYSTMLFYDPNCLKVLIDIALADWNPVYAAASGTVGTIVRKASCGGNIVYVKHLIDGKEYTTRYLHLSSIEVSTGDTVTINTIIGVKLLFFIKHHYFICIINSIIYFYINRIFSI